MIDQILSMSYNICRLGMTQMMSFGFIQVLAINNNTIFMSANKIIQHLRKVQFICEFFVLSKYSQDSHVVPEVLMAIESLKFFFKSIAVSEARGIYLSEEDKKNQQEQQIQDATSTESTSVQQELQKQSKLLDLIKKKPYLSKDYYPNLFEKIGNGKRQQLVTSTKIPKQLKKTTLTFRGILGQYLNILRPLISIISIRIFGIKSYKSYFISLIIDLFIIIVLQKDMTVATNQQRNEIKKRKNSMIMRYIFRRPFYELVKKIVIQPLLGKIIKPDRMVSKFIMSLVDMQSSISLTL